MENKRAIDILFDEIDSINSQIKSEEKTHKKVLLAFKIKKIVNIIDEIDKIKNTETYVPTDFYYDENGYI